MSIGSDYPLQVELDNAEVNLKRGREEAITVVSKALDQMLSQIARSCVLELDNLLPTEENLDKAEECVGKIKGIMFVLEKLNEHGEETMKQLDLYQKENT